MLYDIKDDSLKFWPQQYDELGDRADFEFMHYPCACGSDAKILIGNTTRHRNQFDLYQCQNCGTLRIDPYLTDAGVKKYYSDTYGKIKRSNIPGERLHNRQKKSARLVYEKVAPFVKAGDKILDFGGGAGGKVMELQAQGYDVYIKEMDAKYFAYALEQGLKPYAEGMRFEFIVLSRVLEHVNDPVEFLKYFAADLLLPGGHIYLEVPLIENSRGDYLLNEIHISHKFYFTHLSLKHICALAGFAVAYESRNLLVITPLPKSLNEGGARGRVEAAGADAGMLALSNKVIEELG